MLDIQYEKDMHPFELRRNHPGIYEWFTLAAIPFISEILPEITKQAIGRKPSHVCLELIEPNNRWPQIRAHNHNPKDPEAVIWLSKSDYQVLDATSDRLTKLTIEHHKLHATNFEPGLVARTLPGHRYAHYEIMPHLKSFGDK